MSFFDAINREQRTRLVALALVLGIFVTLPSPVDEIFTQKFQVVLWSLWIGLPFFAWAVWYKKNLIWIFWVLNWTVSTVAAFKMGYRLPFVLLSSWAVWIYLRQGRENSVPKKLIFLMMLSSLGAAADPLDDEIEAMSKEQVPVDVVPTGGPDIPKGKVDEPKRMPIAKPAEAKPDVKSDVKTEAKAETKVEAPKGEAKIEAKPADTVGPEASAPKAAMPKIADEKKPATPAKKDSGKMAITAEALLPKYMRGYELNDLTSCGALEQVPWKFRPDHRRARMLIKDTLRLQTEIKFQTWEIHQVIDLQGLVTYIFRHQDDQGRWESLVIKDATFNRIVETKQGQRLMETQDFRTLVNRPALVLYHQDKSSVSYLPSTVGKSVLEIQLSAKWGRYLPPINIVGSYCDRVDQYDSNLTKPLESRGKESGTP